jgi:hypothetical protein
LKELIILIVDIVNGIHDLIMRLTNELGLGLTDKDLHLWIFGIMGISIFAFVHFVFKVLAKYSLTAISFFYTFTVMLVIVFAVEIQQKVTGRGQMDFDDAVISIWGFLLFFFAYLLIKGIGMVISKNTTKNKKMIRSGK